MQHNVFEPLLYVAALVIALLSFALYRIWKSDPHVAMRAMRLELKHAQTLLEEFRVKEHQWAQDMQSATDRWRNAEADLERLVREVDVMKVRIEERSKTIEMQQEILARNERYQKGQQERIEYLVGRVVQMDMEKGIVTKLPWEQ